MGRGDRERSQPLSGASFAAREPTAALRFGLLVLLVAAVLGTVSASASASASGSAAQPSGKTVTTSRSAAKRTADYWTLHRMRVARPADVVLEGAAPKRRSGSPHKAEGAPVRIPPSPPSGDVPRTRQPRSHIPYLEYQVADPSAYPNVTQGKVFFRVKKRHAHRKKHKWTKYECSATVVNSENKSVVFSAGHCIYDEQRERWANRWTFVPGYLYGTHPFGKFVARDLWALNGWIDDANFNYDVGAAIVRSNGSQLVGDAVGSRGIAWNQDPAQLYAAYGYPGDFPFDGQTLWVCISGYGGDDPQSFSDPGPPTSAIGCDLTAGASGGGWVILNEYLNGLISYGYDVEPGHTYGPYFGDAVGNLFNTVSTR